MLVLVTMVCLGFLVLDVSGNVVTVTLLLIWCYRDMQTTTNLLPGSMAVALHLLILLGLGSTCTASGARGPGCLGHFSTVCLTIWARAAPMQRMAVKVEHHLAVCCPVRKRVLVTQCGMGAFIVELWVVSLFSAGPFFQVVVQQDVLPASLQT
ncbi:Motilin receptor [Cricetulus griseus]|uniref:Motilin receptor n=1 Tax=Cricetulus griseus TaxID=10029 RepID=G3HR80_CRIGR|nr:Motilin receptor [Cricetulus griseus]ERE92106.1 growth hormone secretagogue receptor type 1 [Cricetulus griseus]